MELTDKGAEATLSWTARPKVPADLAAEVRSMSAVGEQYVELLPRTNSGPYLDNGSVIAMSNTKVPQQVGPMLDQLGKLVDTIPKDKLSQLCWTSRTTLSTAQATTSVRCWTRRRRSPGIPTRCPTRRGR